VKSASPDRGREAEDGAQEEKALDPLLDLSDWKTFCAGVPNIPCDNFATLDVSGNDLPDEYGAALISALTTRKLGPSGGGSGMYDLDVSFNALGSASVHALASFLSSAGHNLTALRIRSNKNIGASDTLAFAQFCKSLADVSALRHLNLNDCGLDTACFVHLKNGLRANDSVEHVNTWNNPGWSEAVDAEVLACCVGSRDTGGFLSLLSLCKR